MNIVYQLLSGGTDGFQDIYAEVPWIEFLGRPGQPFQDVLDRVEAMPSGLPRAFKTHSAPPQIPFQEQATGKDVKYIVVFRNPNEALVSFRPFIGQHRDEWFDMWQVPKDALYRPDFPAFYTDVVDANEMQGMFFGFLASWWPLRNKANVLALHYSDMKRDHETAIRKVANFLNIRLTPEQWSTVLTYTSFKWMKQHESKFEARTAGKIPILKSGAMIRKGEIGQARSDGMTDEIACHLRRVGSQVVRNPAAIDWYYNGGEVL
ncbi:MAG: sulfotransferase domain-containing protein [Salinisphaera sp.]|uniref:sulfotransferase domain-containing protein n=1 Tax=Salinisphaera sp. TaxID=1914330 RepID=UPI003C7B84C7